MDERDVSRMLAAAGLPGSGPPTPVTGGWSATQMWRVEVGGRQCVLRLFAPGEGSDARLEERALIWCRARHLPVPELIARRTVESRAMLLLEWIEGRPLHAQVLADGTHARAYGRQFGRLQARLHAEPAPPDLPNALDWPAPAAHPAALRTHLAELSGAERLLHLDYHPSNVLVDNGVITGLIDWTNARLGDPRFDVARTYLILRLLPQVVTASEPALGAAVQAVLPAFRAGWREAYRAGAGRWRDCAPFLAWAGYGLLYDLGRKPLDGAPDVARQALEVVFAYLRRETSGWMAQAGLDV